MVRTTLSFAAVALSALLSTTVTAAPASARLTPACTEETKDDRQEWGKIPGYQRIAYNEAVQCMMSKPSKLDNTVYPAAVSRYHDYTAIHVAKSLNNHVSGFFLTWHRTYVQIWYNDLKETCGYKGPMPYWDWTQNHDDLDASPLFDGSPTSMGSNGDYVDTGPLVLGQAVSLPGGSGGGCVCKGPFSDYKTTFAPINVSVALSGGPLPPTAFDYTPSCLIRDLNVAVARKFETQALVDQAIAAPDIETFQSYLNGNITEGNLGLHSGAHFTVGGAASNLFVSTEDPIWFLLHAYLDKVYTTWQEQHPAASQGVAGTETFGNVPPSPDVTAETYEPDWGYFYPSVTVGSLLNVDQGPFCYRYI